MASSTAEKIGPKLGPMTQPYLPLALTLPDLPVGVGVVDDEEGEALGLVDPAGNVDVAGDVLGLLHLLRHDGRKVGHLKDFLK